MKKAMAATYYEYENRKFHPKALELVDRNFNNVDFTGIITHYTFDTIPRLCGYNSQTCES